MIKKIGVLTSGGDAPGMNAAIRAVVRTAIQKGIEVYGIHDGYLGMYEGRIERLYRKSVSERLGMGGTFLGTARLKDFAKKEVRQIAIDNLAIYGIDAVVTIGGDGTYRGALALSEMGIHTVGVPGTIDNDISGTDFTIGFDTALNTVVEAVDKLRDTSSSHRRCSIIEVMGRNCGDIAVWTAIAVGAEFVVSKETGFDLQAIIDNVTQAAKAKNHAIIIVAENMVDVNWLAKEVSEKTPFDARATILGHIQRGGRPTAKDRVLASEMGYKAVEALLNDETGVCVCQRNNQIITMPINDALGDDTPPVLEKYKVFKVLW
ncbi:MAG: 6-phosphofructokinase [Bacilli bacterium]|jgi:6-phosphofructokinase 1